MMTFSSRIAIAAVASLMLAGAASAQTPAPATSAAPATTAAPTSSTAPAEKTAKPRTDVSLECSKQADAKKLHGKERKTFRSACKKSGGKAT
jgi:phosphate-selective porin